MKIGISKIPYIVFLVVFFVPFFTRGLGVLPGAAVLLYELSASLAFLVAIVYAATHRTLAVDIKYLILFFIVCLHFLAGAVINAEDPVVIVSGLRNYLKYMPLFLLPLAYSFSDEEMKGQLKFLIALGLLQVPLVTIQVFILSWGPDHVAGTLGIGSILSLFLVCSITVLAGFYFRERISGKLFLILATLLFIPTTLNESKATIAFTVLGFLVVMLGGRLRKAHIYTGIGALAMLLTIFVLVYKHSFDTRGYLGGHGLGAFITQPETGISNYLFSGDSANIDPRFVLDAPDSIIGAQRTIDLDEDRIRRADAILLSLRVLAEDPARLMFGLGIGNASSSQVRIFEGQYPFLAALDSSMAALPLLLWEIGVFGLLLYFIFFYFIYKDSRRLAKVDNLSGALALGWTGVVAILVATLPYKNVMQFESAGALFWYFSGYIAAQRYRLEGSRYLHPN